MMEAMRYTGINGSEIIDWCKPFMFVGFSDRLWLKIDKAGVFALDIDDWLVLHDDGAWSSLTSAEVEEDATLLELAEQRMREDSGVRHKLEDVVREFGLE